MTSKSRSSTRKVAGVVLFLMLAMLAVYLILKSSSRNLIEHGTVPTDAFMFWSNMQRAVRTSPDHLVARAAELVESRDPERIYEFVRDQILTCPGGPRLFKYENAALVRWGTRASLRGGMGTMREKVDLLAELYTRAGYQVEILKGKPDSSRVNGQEILSQVIKRNFSPAIDTKTLDTWLSAMGISRAAPAIIDANYTESLALAERIASVSVADDTKQAVLTSYQIEGDIPLLRVRINEQWVYANPLVPGGKFGESYTTDNPRPDSYSIRPPAIKIVLEGVKDTEPEKRFTLIEKSWNPVEVTGRRIALRFLPLIEPESVPLYKDRDVTTWMPALTVESMDNNTNPDEKLLGKGVIIKTSGNRYAVNDAGAVIYNDKATQDTEKQPELQSRVKTIKIEHISNNAYPNVHLSLNILDENEKPVYGLNGGAFELLDEEKQVPYEVLRNKAEPAKILFIFDNSSSVAPEFRNQGNVKNLTSTGMTFFDAIQKAVPDVLFRVGYVLNGEIIYGGKWSNEADTIRSHLNQITFSTSELWSAIADANDSSPTLIVLLSDGDSVDEALPVFKSKISRGSPVLAIGVGGKDGTVARHLSAFAELSGGQMITAANRQEAATFVKNYIDKLPVTDYVIGYDVDQVENTERRKVQIRVKDGTASASGDYTIPKNIDTGRPSRLVSLILTVSIGGDSTSRVIAGSWPTRKDETLNTQDAEDVINALYGKMIFSVEGGPPPLSVLLDEWYENNLLNKPLWDAYRSNDVAQIKQALQSRPLKIPTSLMALASSFPSSLGQKIKTFPDGPQIITYQEKPDFRKKSIERKLDIFIQNKWYTAAQDQQTAWRATLDRTAHLAVLEGKLMSESTLSMLQGKELAYYTVNDARYITAGRDIADAELAEHWRALAYKVPERNYAVVIPRDGSPDAFWYLHNPTGSVLGIMPDITGGTGEAEIRAELARTEQILNIAGRFGPGLGAWASLEKAKARLVANASIMLANMEAPDPQSWIDIGKGLACDFAKEAAGNVIPGSEAFLNLDAETEIINGFIGGNGGILGNMFPDSGC